MEISAPHLLVKLPRTARKDASTQFGSVYTLRDGVKRRRKEICAAIDGDALSIYEAQNGNILTSYPVPPTSSFYGPPCSVRLSADGRLQRRSYCAIRLQSLQIQLFESQDTTIKTSKSPELRDQMSHVLSINVLSDNAEQVLVVQQNGSLSIFSRNLDKLVLSGSLRVGKESGFQILAVQHLSMADARKSVLKQRSDLLGDAPPHTSYLALVYHKDSIGKSSVFYGLWPIEPFAEKAWASTTTISPLFEHELATEGKTASLANAKDEGFTFGHLASHLYVRSGEAFLTYELTGFVPLLVSVLHTGLSGTYEMMPISPAFAICSVQDSLRLYDLKFQSIRLQLDTKKANLKRKRVRTAVENQSGPVEFITYLTQSGRIIGQRHNQLVAIDISIDAESKKVLEHGSKLLHSIGRGVSSQDGMHATAKHVQPLNIGTFNDGARTDADWQALRKRLDQLAEASDVAGFEDAFTGDVRSQLLHSSFPGQTIDDLPVSRFSIPDVRVNYLISKIFHLDFGQTTPNNDAPGAGTLKVQLPTFRLIVWLSRLGLLCHTAVKRALSAALSGSVESITVHSIAHALLNADPSRNLLVECLENGFSPYVEEQAAVVQVLLQQALATAAEAAQSPVAAEAHSEDDAKQNMQLQTLSASKSESSWLPAELQRALIKALDRLGASSTAVISKNLRILLDQREVLALIQFLRQQLFQGGHTRSLQSLPPIDTESGNLTAKLDGVVKILSSCVDAIGPLGFVAASENEDFIGNIVPDLATEITHATQSLEDATELQGVLRETLRYEESVRKHQSAGGRMPVTGPEASLDQQPGTILTLYSEASEGDDSLQVQGGLPLALHVDNVVNPLKVRKGGGQVSKRSVSQKKMLESRNKGQYQYERLVL
ncbi:hypothetical protein LTR10_022819 [Elasticomyces elasticus]|uniref:Utp8 beta-propeller domain-containing protein n=1 Tax=Exophiala sideris TaxID=1016849 RepID=A0ABR0JHD9_9EURO|nr:hypothetical protein LTR10_022819 [Elasticomyces elasticus]KAK5033579.1 hypothetical protein LTS07_003884 [Exophiala sideris]KAK5041926.1 hypothetical protein LTR13_001731 [Exophiala sideris]KAK5064123.1 hypothetical protein LTR69_003892 [Exophiala sideris]KAK5185194.1 hypothetical protein LTR44_002182 [Eurotiomycetes sp. CCFEE 6388]